MTSETSGARHNDRYLAVVGAIVRGGEVLLARAFASDDSWEMPGGKADPSETAKQALKRELLKQFGCEFKIGEELAGVHLDPPVASWHYDVRVLLATPTDKLAPTISSEVAWFPLETPPAAVTPATAVALAALRARAGLLTPVSLVLDAIRAAGWSVAVHNDYHLDGVPHTFWLFTKGNQCVKGEGRTDAEALEIVRRGIDTLDRVLERDLINDHCRSDPPTRVRTRLAVLTRAGTLACTVVAAGLRGQAGPYSLNRVRGDHLTTDSVFVLDDAQLRVLDSRHAVDVGDVHVKLMRVKSEDLHEWLAASRVGG